MCLKAGQRPKSVCPACVIKEKRSEFWFGDRRSLERALFGRVPRRVFWVSALLCSVLGWLVGWLYATLYMTTMTEITWDFVTVAVGAFQIWLALISVSISVRRLHDVGRNGLWFCRSFSFPYWELFSGLCSAALSESSTKTVTVLIHTPPETISTLSRPLRRNEAIGVKNAY